MAARPLSWAALFVWALAMTGCAVQTKALREHPPLDLPPAVELQRTPFFAQTAYQCGPAALATVLAAAGLPADPALLGEQVFLPARTGTLQIEMMSGARRQGAVATRLPTSLEALLREVSAGHPVVVFQNLGLSWAPRWHYAVLVGYDIQSGDVILRSGSTERQVMLMRTLEHTWKRAGSWAFVALPPGQWPITAEEKAVIEASVGFERVATPAQAITVYRSALARWPHSLSLRMGLGNSLYGAGDKPAAVEVFREAAKRHRSAAAWINAASTLLELGEVRQAAEAAREAVAASDDVWRSRAEAVQAEAQRALMSAAVPLP